MRIWSLHPRYLDRQGLIACWRETLLAQAVLNGATRGYTRHPQLERFRETDEPLASIGAYLHGLATEADHRGYRFDRSRIVDAVEQSATIGVTDGQIALEWAHLLAKLAVRSPELRERWADITRPEPHPLFTVTAGPIASWERAGQPPT
ncbi:pyrimidine dimer DNA glycosylase/endonuclease V [Microbacterium sp. M28]|uniref:pyrimidine dimer DNA glycosylase/endonuclease V n=1 Tax=Microbacterium sp. M28 TaxID=2962064 RepID=UPI0021F4AD03|nr:pyrimidine dimer DNA glycosylase/endonuclease V [Microbacterium sp. M28]UYO98463.1 pyrimidine dimer DNA glycosylase/endonuclease V [Microbacterium sp. M28]